MLYIYNQNTHLWLNGHQWRNPWFQNTTCTSFLFIIWQYCTKEGFMGVSLQYVCTLINQHFHTYCILNLISIFCGNSFFRQLLFFWSDGFSLVIWSDCSGCFDYYVSLVSLNWRLDWSLLVEMEGVFLHVHEWRGHWVQQLSTDASWVIPQCVMWWKWSLWWYGWAGNMHAVLREEGNRDYMSTSSPYSLPMNYESAFQESFGLWSAVISSYGLVVLASVQPIIS